MPGQDCGKPGFRHGLYRGAFRVCKLAKSLPVGTSNLHSKRDRLSSPTSAPQR